MTSHPAHVVGVAVDSDEPVLRRLLRENPMAGAVSLSLEREPNFGFAAAIEGDRNVVVVARDDHGRPAALATRSVRSAFVNGQPVRIGYLGQLRLGLSLRGSRRVLREGFSLLRSHRREDELPFDFTSIVADNAPARRLLEAGLAGLPRYEPVGELVTLAFSTSGARRRMESTFGSGERLEEIAAFLREQGARRQLAPCPTAADLASPIRARDLAPGDFILVERGERLAGCAAIWDQRAFKQMVVRAYAPFLKVMRPLLSFAGPVFGLPRLPREGKALASAFLAFPAVVCDDHGLFGMLLDAALTEARRRRIELLVLGLGANHPFLTEALRRPCKVYRSVLYSVHYAEESRAAPMLDGRPLGPEVATL